MKGRYLFEHSWEHERERLDTMARGMDPLSIEILESIGVDAGWRCLEIGAGLGTISRWLADRVGPEGSVVATDLETDFLEEITAPNVEVRRHDVRTDPLEPSAYDLVFARKVLEHMPECETVLEKLVDAARPGGWLVVEDPDLVSALGVDGPDPKFLARAYRAFVQTLADGGYQPTLGTHLGPLLVQAGLRDVQVRGRGAEWGGGTSARSVYHRTFEKLRDSVVAAGRLSESEADGFLEALASDSFRAFSAIHYAAWGRKPEPTA